MAVCPAEHGLQADIIFVVEGTAVNGAYINDIKTNYIIPSLEYFSQGNIDDTNYVSENASSEYGIVVYHAADCLPHPSSETYGPFSTPTKLLNAIDRLDLIGGKGESHSNIAEGLATALHCFEELQQKTRYLSYGSEALHFDMQLTALHASSFRISHVFWKSINLSVISPRKIPSLYKLFEKGGGDLSSSQTKNYAKDPRHLVLLKGFRNFSHFEHIISHVDTSVNSMITQISRSRQDENKPSKNGQSVRPPGNATPSQSQIPNPGIPIPSLPSPLPGSDSPIQGASQPTTNMHGTSATAGVAANVAQNTVYRAPGAQGMNPSLGPPQKGVVNVTPSRIMGNNHMQVPAPPGYHAPPGHVNRASPHWTMPPPAQQPRPYLQPSQQGNATQGSALIAQLTQPPSSLSGSGVNQFNMNTNSSLNKIQTSMAPNQAGIQTSMAQVNQANQVVTSQAQGVPPGQQQQMAQVRERHTIWQGLLEWIEKPKNDQPKITKHVPCKVSANCKDGEPELKADGWPQKLMMQLMPKQLIGNIGGAYLNNSKSVLFHPQPSDALESLTRVMSSGFAGCVHFSTIPNQPACDIKVLILLYTADKRAYLGFIPNDQAAFIDRLRKVIQQQKSSQQNMRQAGPGQSINSQVGTPPQMSGANTVTSQQNQSQQNLLISQTNTISMGGGQITQNVNSSGQPGQGMGGMIGQSVSPGMRPNIRMQGIQPGSNQPNMQPGMMQNQVQRAPFENQLEVERRQNLEKINQLKQTLEAAQQQEQQYKKSVGKD
ncbi:hypothetical protein NQ317_004944 [Molorchus minor]|uniref:Mediator of RNA polymerase II transcription subunit 25 n=1 Tax=Molorchus minor TaxID=1323400 RepID=A0ABQ9ISD7_9CUCU|nr:hypothetical protein NQ317_004944 [Molorchus minor]